MPHWTNHEVRRLKEIYGCVATSEVEAMIPRHSLAAIRNMASKFGLRKSTKRKTRRPHERLNHWLRIAHLHFSNRETEMRS